MTLNRRCFLASIIASVVREPALIYPTEAEKLRYGGAVGWWMEWKREWRKYEIPRQ